MTTQNQTPFTSQSREELIRRQAEIRDRIFSLECSDDRLFSNANGNYPLWKSLNAEAAEISKQLSSIGESR
jgi:hypothetical protein